MKHELVYHFRILRHFFLSGSKFDIHSPFVYKIYSEILKDKTDYQEYNTLLEKMMVRNSRVSIKYDRLLFRLTRYFRPKTILTLGTMDEIGRSYLAMGSPCSHIIDFPDNPGSLADFGLIDMIFVAGDHRKDVLLDYFFRIMQHIHNDSVLIFSNIHGSKETHEAWKEIKNHPSITLTIDLFRMGLVFCKEELSKEDFILRY
jgi:hypothetical protein